MGSAAFWIKAYAHTIKSKNVALVILLVAPQLVILKGFGTPSSKSLPTQNPTFHFGSLPISSFPPIFLNLSFLRGKGTFLFNKKSFCNAFQSLSWPEIRQMSTSQLLDVNDPSWWTGAPRLSSPVIHCQLPKVFTGIL